MGSKSIDGLSLIRIREAVEGAWSFETSFCDSQLEYYGNDKAFCQCGVTALLIQEIKGGLLMKGMVNGQPHYWNFIDGWDIDLTWRQFPAGAGLMDVRQCFREDILANTWFEERYNNFKSNFEKNIK